MAATPPDLFAFLAGLGISVRTVEHAPLFTVADSQKLRGDIPGGHTKNLFLKDKKGRIFLVVLLEDAVVDLKRLHDAIGASGRLSFGSAELLRATLGVEPGSVTPFAAINDEAGVVTVVLDTDMLACEQLNYHPLVNTMTSGIAREDLIAFLRATGHEPLILPVARPAGRADAERDCHSAGATPS
ncbi:YbaK/EbsC family protein [Chelatococcus sp. SYSU_G07232]|uniref:YbaK/EbsC family protein n=1 Tax=Chelatococcus albus TaxID=3047466 RepID=A0ABT7AJB1_9HYPH|nr:YbaK/EbsC family protein [Chelatococcus sp. SYSU_G07232]MDJ1158681.1 YbaK/EbsC family protein [Chelatococcus sp. SYSU_G07232]